MSEQTAVIILIPAYFVKKDAARIRREKLEAIDR